MIIYFSGTGNSRFAAEFLAKQLSDELLDAGQRMKAGERDSIHSDRPWVFAAPLPVPKVGLLDKLKSGPINEGFYKFYVKADAFFATDACTGCGFCVVACPLNNIRLNGGKPVWGKNCTHCMACICGCPAEAIEYGKRSRGKPRYQCPKDENL